MNEKSSNLPHVVIVGAGFGGLRAALAFAGRPVQVTLVDRNNYHLFQPLLYQVATSMISPDGIAYPVRATLHHKRNLTFHLGEVESIDLANHRLLTNNGDFSYDYLILAPGGETNYFGNDSLAENTMGLKDLTEATQIRNHLLHQFELAALEPDPETRRAMLRFVVVGGGPTGVECAGAISELIRIVLHKDYPTLRAGDVQVILLEAGDRLLASLPAELGQATVKELGRKQVEVRFHAQVSAYTDQVVQLKNGDHLAAQTLIWAAGVRAEHLLNSLGLDRDRLGRVKVLPTLQTPAFPQVFVIGDAAFLTDQQGQPLPMVAPVAMQQANLAAKNILSLINGEPMEPFVYHDPGVMATIGRNQAVAWIKGLKFHGFIAWVLWLVVHIYQLIGFRNRLAVLLDWAWSYLFYERAARLIIKTEVEPAQKPVQV